MLLATSKQKAPRTPLWKWNNHSSINYYITPPVLATSFLHLSLWRKNKNAWKLTEQARKLLYWITETLPSLT